MSPRSKGFRSNEEERSAEVTPLGRIIDGLLTRREFRSAAGIGRLMTSWEVVVGEKLASETLPAALERHVLVIGASSGAWAAQVRFLAEEIRGKANELLGSDEVEQVRVTVRKPL